MENSNNFKPNMDALRKADPNCLYIEALEQFPYMMTPDDVAAFLGQTKQAVTQYLRENRMPGTKCGKYWLVPKKQFIEYLYENGNGSVDKTAHIVM